MQTIRGSVSCGHQGTEGSPGTQNPSRTAQWRKVRLALIGELALSSEPWRTIVFLDKFSAVGQDTAREVVDPDRCFGDWNLEDLWAADLGLLHDRLKRAEAGVLSPRDLVSFWQRKYLFHCHCGIHTETKLPGKPGQPSSSSGSPVKIEQSVISRGSGPAGE